MDSEEVLRQITAILYDPKRHGYESGSESDFPVVEEVRALVAELKDARALMNAAYSDSERAISRATEAETDLKCLQESTVDFKAYDALVAERDALKAEKERLREWNQQMVERAAGGGVLDGYRELGQRCAALEAENERLRGVIQAEADCCQRWADHYATSNPDRSARHQHRGDRLRAALQENSDG